MESKVWCMNGLCGATISSTTDCKKGWPLRSGESASLCDKCGSAYEQLIFCDMFHLKDTGWRECTSCGKRLHCGCIASSSLLELLDGGGVNCINCAKKLEHLSTPNHEKLKGCGLSSANSAGEMQSSSVGNQLNGGSIDRMKLTQFSDCTENSTQKELLLVQTDDGKKVNGQMKLEEISSIPGEVGSMLLSRCSQASAESSQNTKNEIYKGNMGVKDPNEALVLTNLSIALSSPTANTNLQPAVVVEEGDVSKSISSFQQCSRSRHLLPKPPKYVIAPGLEAGADTVSQIRVARPPVEGRIKNQLLPRYWPRITDQELQQISGDSNATIVPLFEKVLSASDAGRIGRLVLPKACAEAYFPPISQPEGLPLRIQDVKGKEWVFQFRFWPNNNSRMYVLEGVTPCIQSMQLQAGDTVTFSRMDPGGKLLMGFRKASTTVLLQDTHLSALSKSAYSSEPFFPDVTGNLSTMSGYSGFLQSLKASGNSPFAKECNSSDMNLCITEKVRNKSGDIPLPPSMLVPERKRSRNIGSKSKRLVIDNHDALELKLSWEEVQDMLRPPFTAEPTTVMIEDHEFEEYEEPPVFGKRSIFTVRLSGVQEQWAQCDSCLKWRRLPADFLLPAKWTCQENIWDDSRCSCSAPDELSPRELENLLKMNKDFKKLRSTTSPKPDLVHESVDVDALGNAAAAAVGGDMTSDSGATSVATTTKHPRHRPGCSCIVCIQPPSGKGKHKPTCTCNVCMTVKRRFKTLMMRKKKRQSEREAEIAQRNQFMWSRPEELEVDSICRQVTSQSDPIESKRRSGSEFQVGSQCNNQLQESAEIGKGQLDLNSNPDHEDLHMRSSRGSMMSLLQEASMPLETYLKQNGLTSLVYEQQGSSGSQALPQATGESEIQVPEDHSHPPGTLDQGDDEELSEPDNSGNNPS